MRLAGGGRFYVCALCLAVAFSASTADAQFTTVINLPDDQPSISGSIGDGTQLNVYPGGEVIGPFSATAGSEINAYGGILGQISATAGSTVNVFDGELNLLTSRGEANIFGGNFSREFYASLGSVAHVSGGNFPALQAWESTLVVSGGLVRDGIHASTGTDVRILGGDFSSGSLSVARGGSIHLFGGHFSDIVSLMPPIAIYPASKLHLQGSEFFLDGQPIPGLVNGVTVPILERDTEAVRNMG